VALGYETLDPAFAATIRLGHDLNGEHQNNPVAGRQLRHQAGTLWATDTALLAGTLPAGRFDGVVLHLEGLTSWACDRVLLGNNRLTFGPAAFTVTATNGLTIGTNGYLEVQGDVRVPDGNLTIAQNGALTLRSAATGTLDRAFGSLVEVGDTLAIETGAWIYPYSHRTDGGSVLIHCGALMIDAGGGIDADGLGFAWGTGPGSTAAEAAGGGFGGRGGNRQLATSGGGAPYGVPFAPTLPGSGGG
jgi:hypothetical protein